MSHAAGWAWTVLIVAAVLMIPARVFHSLLLTVIALVLLPVALLVFL